jgi:hypothetical protein
MDAGLGGVVGLHTRARNYRMDPAGQLSKVEQASQSEHSEGGFERYGISDEPSDHESREMPSPYRMNSYLAPDFEVMKKEFTPGPSISKSPFSNQ